MSGPFDNFPPPGRIFAESTYPSLERLQTYLTNRLRSQRRQQALRALDVLDEELQLHEADSVEMSTRRPELRRSESSRFTPRRDGSSSHRGIQQNSTDNGELHQSASNSGRPRSSARQQTTFTSFQGDFRPPREFEGLETLQRVENHLREVHTSINDLFEDELGNSVRSPLLPAHGNHSQNDDDLDQRRRKRIKLDADDNREGPRRYRYGHYGQVVPRSLDMEIVSCDGGSYEAHGKNSCPENILVDDRSVYCTKNDRCNIILRHEGEIPFCLKKLVIRAPKSGFDSPNSVREGMVFVAMNADDLLSRTTQYQIAYTPSYQRRIRAQNRRSRNSDIVRSSLLSLDRTIAAELGVLSDSDQALNSTSGASQSRNARRQTTSRGLLVTTDHDDVSEDDLVDERDEEEDDVHSSQGTNTDDGDQMTQLLAADDTDTDGSEPSDFDLDPSLLLSRRMSADQPGSPTSEMVRLARQRLARQRLEGNGPGSRQLGGHSLGGRQGSQPTPAQHSPPIRRQHSNFDSNVGPLFNGDTGNENSLSSSESTEVMKPHARFSIERERSMINIKFDPPASGRFVLIKLWSPCSGGNIDIQSVVARGFAGPRFFPSVEFR